MPAGFPNIISVSSDRKVAKKYAIKATKSSRKRKRKGATAQGGVALFNKPSPFPIIWKGAKQSYVELQAFTVGASGAFGAEQEFRLNSQFDPNETGTGHQPYGRDTFATMYDRYKVTYVTFEVTFTNPSAGANLACAILLRNPTNLSALATKSYTTVKEMPNSKVVLLNEGGGKQIVTIKRSYPMHVLLGVSKLQFDADVGVFDAIAANDPSATAGVCRLVVAIADSTKGSDGTCDCSTRITMTTDWYERKTLAQS